MSAYQKSLRIAVQPENWYISLLPVLLTIILVHRLSVDSRWILTLQSLSVIALAISTQSIHNLYASNGNTKLMRQLYHGMTIKRSDSAQNAEPPKVVLNLLSSTQIRRWACLLYGLVVIIAVGSQWSSISKKSHVAWTKRLQAAVLPCVLSAIVFYCAAMSKKVRWWTGFTEIAAALLIGPFTMAATSYFLIYKVPFIVGVYGCIVFMYTIAFELAQSACDAPISEKLAKSNESLAKAMGFERTFRVCILFIASAMGLLFLSSLMCGYLTNFGLLFLMPKLKEITEAFRHEKLRDIPDNLARLTIILGASLIVSIPLSHLLLPI
ncbi:unnamed protein product [Albugo candida]|uniref:Uncharacterized protein n=1 Tax=Albugo candida TaxID=65357 RepID=A0A024FY58_9STRA|nr:unnamed protein product [Albugo candida]|eukprot:CCI39421.1 unnamed protein product [Albugo candida]